MVDMFLYLITIAVQQIKVCALFQKKTHNGVSPKLSSSV